VAVTTRFHNPETMAPPSGFSQVVEASVPGRLIFISGQLGVGRDGKVAGAPGDFRAQAVQAFENLKAALMAADAGFEHVVKLNNYLVDLSHLPLLREVRNAYLKAEALPASTTVQVTAFARPGALYEVDAIAVVD
jgi:enamine deaminase RidA (YjgF/YER057c/UK114 family)